MRKVLVLVLAFVLMFGLVMGAGYNVVVPPAAVVPPATTSSSSSSSSSGGAAANVTTNDTNDTTVVAGDGEDGDTTAGDSPLSDAVGGVVGFVKGLGWGTVLVVLALLAVIGGASWYVLKDKRKKFVEIRSSAKK